LYILSFEENAKDNLTWPCKIILIPQDGAVNPDTEVKQLKKKVSVCLAESYVYNKGHGTLLCSVSLKTGDEGNEA